MARTQNDISRLQRFDHQALNTFAATSAHSHNRHRHLLKNDLFVMQSTSPSNATVLHVVGSEVHAQAPAVLEPAYIGWKLFYGEHNLVRYSTACHVLRNTRAETTTGSSRGAQNTALIVKRECCVITYS